MPIAVTHLCPRSRQRGAVIITTALALLFLLGFMGIALDFGRLFVVKTELQTAMDSCALAAAQELDGLSGARERATNAGKTAGNLNRVNLQSTTWSGEGQIVDTDITFKDAAYGPTINDAAAKYAQCQHTQANVKMWLLAAMGAFSGDKAGNPPTHNVAATAVATRASAQSTCPVPVALHPKTFTPPQYGFVVGEWVTMLNEQSAEPGGTIGWADLDEVPGGGANSLKNQLNGFCGNRVGDTLEPVEVTGTIAALVEAWNSRFGIYKNNVDPGALVNNPDFTGYAYTAKNWPAQWNAYDGLAPSPEVPNFVDQRKAFASCGTQVRGAPTSCESITGLSLNSFQKVAPSGNVAGGHKQYGRNRRIVTVPIVDASSVIIDYACMLMLQPLTVPSSTIKLEFRGNAGAPGSPCTTSGLPGGFAGPLVPVLVK